MKYNLQNKILSTAITLVSSGTLTIGFISPAYGALMKYSIGPSPNAPDGQENVSGMFFFDPELLNIEFELEDYNIIFGNETLNPDNTDSQIGAPGDGSVDIVISNDENNNLFNISLPNGLPTNIGDMEISDDTTPQTKITKVPIPEPNPLVSLVSITALTIGVSTYKKLST